ncbi:MAG: hypothetical protein ACD_75C00544G0002 [uncultured bacterium]|nr:MAG: hypothetical protein ACD_75C00544G0002 [uncultured bacterium]
MIVGVLKENSGCESQFAQHRLGQLPASIADNALLTGMEAVKVFDQGGLARTVPPDQGDPVAGIDLQRDVPQAEGAVRIPERDLAKVIERRSIFAADIPVGQHMHGRSPAGL